MASLSRGHHSRTVRVSGCDHALLSHAPGTLPHSQQLLLRTSYCGSRIFARCAVMSAPAEMIAALAAIGFRRTQRCATSLRSSPVSQLSNSKATISAVMLSHFRAPTPIRTPTRSGAPPSRETGTPATPRPASDRHRTPGRRASGGANRGSYDWTRASSAFWRRIARRFPRFS